MVDRIGRDEAPKKGAQYQPPVGETDVIRVDTGDGALRDANGMLAVVAAHAAWKEST
jgi:hypothetical protein